MRYLSLFSGIGGFELGIQQAYEHIQNDSEAGRCGQKEDLLERPMPDTGSEPDIGQSPTCIGYSEIDKYACQIYDKHFNHKNYGDITTINPKELPDFDLLVGGFPCQAFSIAGKRKGFDDTRGTLFFDIARILSEKRPRYLVLENVKGLLSHDKGQTFQTILGVLSDLGYAVEWQVLNSKNFGVPQNRERVFIIGYFGGFPRRKLFPIRGTDTETYESKGIQQISSEREISRTLLARDYKDPKIVQVNKPKHTFVQRQPLKFLDRNQKNIEGDYSFTVDSMNTGGVRVDTKIRRLTPVECERLQGFSDNWTQIGTKILKDNDKTLFIPVEISDTQRYKTLGNAVTVNVIQAIFERLI